MENVALCLLDGLVLCLEQNFQKLGGVLVWEKLAGAEGEGRGGSKRRESSLGNGISRGLITTSGVVTAWWLGIQLVEGGRMLRLKRSEGLDSGGPWEPC